VVERVPVAFVREGNHIGLVDRRGVLLDMPPAMMAAKRYSFPVVTGVTTQQTAEERADRMRLYTDFMKALASSGGGAASQLSEVDLSDPEDVRVLLPSAGSDLLIHFGSEDFAARWQRLEEKLPGWKQQYPQLAGVDLRYQRQTVLQMARSVAPATPPAASAISAPVAAKPPLKAAAQPLAHRHPVIQHGKIAPAHKQPAKPVVKKKPARRETHG
jgi:cell division protein FtsQ